MSKSKKMICEENETMLARANSQIGSLKRYNSRKLILQYSELLSDKVLEYERELYELFTGFLLKI